MAFHRLRWLTACAAAALLLQSSFWHSRIPWVVKLALVALAGVSAWRPQHAAVALAALVPYGHVLISSVWDLYPFRLTEALVLGFLTGYLTWRLRQRASADERRPADGLFYFATLLALVVLASAAVQIAGLQVWHDYPLAYARRFLTFLASGYLTTVTDLRPWVDGRGLVFTAAALLESAALLLALRYLCARNPGLTRRVVVTVVCAGVGAAALSFYKVGSSAMSGTQPLDAVINAERWYFAIPSVNTSGSFFLMVAGLSAAFVVSNRRRPWRMAAYLVATVVLLGAMQLTRTRAALVAGLAIAAAFGAWAGMTRYKLGSPARAVLLAAVILPAAVAAIIVYNPFDLLAPGAEQSLRLRVLFAQTAARMIASAPLFGVGLARYELRYPEFSAPELLSAYQQNNAHNQFLWIAAELGVVGFVAFAGMLGASFALLWSRVRSAHGDYWLPVASGAVAAFVLTWMSGQPLTIPEAAYTFWIVLGALVGPGVSTLAAAAATRRAGVVALAVAASAIGASVPIRAMREIDAIDRSRVTYGLYGWDGTPDGVRYRWSAGRATVFLRSSVTGIELPLRANLAGSPNGVQVEIAVDGRTISRETIDDMEWRRVRLRAPHDREAYWRVDLRIEPTWIPRDVLPDSADGRELGLMVGEISVLQAALLPAGYDRSGSTAVEGASIEQIPVRELRELDRHHHEGVVSRARKVETLAIHHARAELRDEAQVPPDAGDHRRHQRRPPAGAVLHENGESDRQ
jgi:O-antigen ligase